MVTQAPSAEDASTSPSDAATPNTMSKDGSIEVDAGTNDASQTCVLRAADGGAPLTPPSALANAMANAAPGDVVSLGGMNESQAPTLAVSVCPAVDAPTLLFSDSPESPNADGILYADSVNAGRYRLYLYQANGGNAPRKFPVVALNQGTTKATVKMKRRGLAAASKQYVSVGKTVLLDWLADKTLPDVVVPPGERVLLDSALDAIHAGKDELVHAIFDVEIDAPLKISFVSVSASANAVNATASLSLLAADADHQRGTFANADVVVSAAPNAQKPGVQRMRLGLDEIDATMTGVDKTTGSPRKLLGNYGMLYRFTLGVPGTARAGIAPRGGAWGGVARVGTTSIALPSATQTLDTTTDAIALGAIGPATEVRLMTAGGSNLPVDLFLVSP